MKLLAAKSAANRPKGAVLIRWPRRNWRNGRDLQRQSGTGVNRNWLTRWTHHPFPYRHALYLILVCHFLSLSPISDAINWGIELVKWTGACVSIFFWWVVSWGYGLLIWFFNYARWVLYG